MTLRHKSLVVHVLAFVVMVSSATFQLLREPTTTISLVSAGMCLLGAIVVGIGGIAIYRRDR